MIVSDLLRDARELARTAAGRVDPRTVLRIALSADSYTVTSLCRLRTAARRWHLPGVNHLLRMAQTAIYGIEIGSAVTLGHGVYFIHPTGVVVGGDAKIGNRVRFLGANTIGNAREDGYPVIEDDVTIGAGARILGPVRIGARAIIGANAVVLTDVPPDHLAVGVPARVVPRRPVRLSAQHEPLRPTEQEHDLETAVG